MSGLVERATIGAGSISRGRRVVTIKRLLAALAVTLGLIAATTYGVRYWEVGRFQVETDDAYVQADSIIIAPRVPGYIAEVLVNDNQPVKAGQVLARIDDRDLRTALDQASADRDAAEHKVANLAAQLQLQQSLIDEAAAQVASAEAAATFAAQDQRRYSDLAHTGAGSIQQAQQTQMLLLQRTADLQHAHAALTTARQQVEVLRTAEAEAQSALEHARAVEQQAHLNLGYATITAPQDGTIGARSLRVGQYVQAGTQLMAVVPLRAVYVVANYKETQLTGVRPGQPVEIEVDTFPDHAVRGVVDSIAPASGQQFALLPPDNATGNFTKIVQRIPVKIVLRDDSKPGLTLRPGMSVEPTIDTRGG
ncbi:MAG TPA: HlyD family secretion protein [Acetobacteraceae bacterium]|jgi:membrane fusion protein (multidrug efflux system)|nr:HlyD family secretion protein [Acetobacteraceae bacterium]